MSSASKIDSIPKGKYGVLFEIGINWNFSGEWGHGYCLEAHNKKLYQNWILSGSSQ